MTTWDRSLFACIELDNKACSLKDASFQGLSQRQHVMGFIFAVASVGFRLLPLEIQLFRQRTHDI